MNRKMLINPEIDVIVAVYDAIENLGRMSYK